MRHRAGTAAEFGAEKGPPTAEYSAPFLHASKSLAGPFTRVNVSLPPGHSPMAWGYDNPAPFVPAPQHSNLSVYVTYESSRFSILTCL